MANLRATWPAGPVARACRIIARGDQPSLLCGLAGTVNVRFDGPVPGQPRSRPGLDDVHAALIRDSAPTSAALPR